MKILKTFLAGGIFGGMREAVGEFCEHFHTSMKYAILRKFLESLRKPLKFFRFLCETLAKSIGKFKCYTFGRVGGRRPIKLANFSKNRGQEAIENGKF